MGCGDSSRPCPPALRAACQDDVLRWLRDMEPLTLSRGAWFYKAEKALA